MVAMTALDSLRSGPTDPGIGPSPANEGPVANGEGGFSRLVDEAGQALDGAGETSSEAVAEDGQDSPADGQGLPLPVDGTVAAGRSARPSGEAGTIAGALSAGHAGPSMDGTQTRDANPTRDGRVPTGSDPVAQGLVAGLPWTGQSTGRANGPLGPLDTVGLAGRVAKTGSPSPGGVLSLSDGLDGDVDTTGPMQAQGLRPDRGLLPGQSSVMSPSSDAPRPDAFQALVHGGLQADSAVNVTAMADPGNGHAPSLASGPAGALSGPASTPPAPTTSQTVPQLPMTSTMGQAAWADELGQRVHWFVGQNVQRAELLLHPAHLGTVEISIVMQQDHVQVSLQSHHAQVREAMEAALPRLREQFQDGGGQTTVQVDVSGRDDRPGDEAGAAARQADPSSDPDPISDPDAPPSMTSMVTNGGSGLLDRYV